MIPQQRVYYEYVNGELCPYWYVLTFEPCQIGWDKPTIFFDVFAPFEYLERDCFDESLISISIFISDLIINGNNPSRLGINLARVKARLNGLEPELITQFVIQMPDIEEVLSLLPNRRTQAFLINS